jgi:hypothetical protein
VSYRNALSSASPQKVKVKGAAAEGSGKISELFREALENGINLVKFNRKVR